MAPESRYVEYPNMLDIKTLATEWLQLPLGATIDLHDVDQCYYNEGKPFMAILRAAGFLIEQGEFKQVRTKAAGFGLRVPNTKVIKRTGNREAWDLPWGALGGPCPVCGVEFLWYGANGRPRKYCTPTHATRARVKRSRTKISLANPPNLG
jgi:hypothetical protein